MGETKSSNGVSGNKKVVRTERVSKLENYTDGFEFVAMEFSPKDRIYEKNENSGDSAGTAGNPTDSSIGKKEIDISQKSSYIQTGNNLTYEFNPEEIKKNKLEMKLKGGKEKEEQQEQQEQQEK